MEAEAVAGRRTLERHAEAGVTFLQPETTRVEEGVDIGRDTVVHGGASLIGATRVGEGCEIGPHSTIRDSSVGDGAAVIQSYLVEAEVHANARVGPFAYLRPGALLEEGAKAGTFVEVKNSRIGEGSKVPHLAYVGDAEVGPGSNLGAGTITANYDGFRKHRTVIGANARIGVDTMLIAPVEVGDSAYTGAGTVVQEDVPDGALAVSQNDQRNIEGFAERKSAESKEEDES
jgi:bifunctional UDP-N-acetylglucosamine pyrophosphorylase/glucosamine-1-phosphate N-acetyltransferase